MLDNYENGPMDVRNWAVFAKRTRSRIILVSLTRGEDWGIEAEIRDKVNDQNKEPDDRIWAGDRFHTYEVDWRNGAANPRFEFRPGTPCFDDDFDFYRTLVIMSAPTCERVEGNDVWYSRVGAASHFTMWLPNWKSYLQAPLYQSEHRRCELRGAQLFSRRACTRGFFLQVGH